MTSVYYHSSASDRGGVHDNDGVDNKAAYLMTDGATFNGQTIAGLGAAKVAQIYYKVETSFLTSGSDYQDLGDALQAACSSLIGSHAITSSDCGEVTKAVLATEMNQTPPSASATDALICPAGQTVNNIFFDDLESGTSKWTFGAISGTSRWQYDSPYGVYAHSGSHFLYADDYPAAVDDSFVAMKTSVTLPAGAYLHFAHAYGFENPNYDGGVLEYSTNAGGSWSDAGSLFVANGYNGPLASSNPLGARSAFRTDSHGYISSRLNLASLADQSIRFRWRMGLDSVGADWGWWLDDVRIYTCGSQPPSISGFTPSSGPVGTSVTIAGQNFTGATAVMFNGTSASFTVGSPTSIIATLPAGATSGPISVTTPNGTGTSASSFTVTPPAPQVISFTPTSGPIGTSVTISGRNFTGATAVAFNGTSASFTVGSDTSIATNVPLGATTGPISVTTLAGSAISATSYSVAGTTLDQHFLLPVMRR
jgi:Thermolysin metallopeptidase, alpha-helical domain